MRIPLIIHFDNALALDDPHLWIWYEDSVVNEDIAPTNRDDFGSVYQVDVRQSRFRLIIVLFSKDSFANHINKVVNYCESHDENSVPFEVGSNPALDNPAAKDRKGRLGLLSTMVALGQPMIYMGKRLMWIGRAILSLFTGRRICINRVFSVGIAFD